MARVHRHEIAASELAYPAQIFATVSVRTARGVFQARADHAPGSTELGMTDADRREKFLECTEALMDEASALTLMNAIDHCETLPDISALVQALKV
jgi:hypothetical protein